MTTGLVRMEQYFVPMFYFAVILTAVGVASHLLVYAELLFPSSTHGGSMSWWSWRLKNILYNLLLTMAAFIPIIIVTRRASFSSAFDICTRLWAHHAKSMIAFVLVGTLLLLIPRILRDFSRFVFDLNGFWETRVTSSLVSLFEIAVGALIVSSMVVFCRRIQEEEESERQETESK